MNKFMFLESGHGMSLIYILTILFLMQLNSNLFGSFAWSNRLACVNQLCFPSTKDNELALRICSFNIRGDLSVDRDGENAWDIRKYKIQKLMHYYQPDIIGLQEMSERYVADLLTLFPAYTLIAYDTRPGAKDVAILVKKDRFTIESHNYFWLSNDPWDRGIPEKASWDAREPRIVVYALLYDYYTHKQCAVLCTHFDSAGSQSRLEGAQVIIEEQKRRLPQVPTIIMGDFNVMLTGLIGEITRNPEISEKADETYKIFINDTGFHDIRDGYPQNKHYGPDGSWIGWSYDKFAAPQGTIGERLDHIFVRRCTVLQEGVLNIKINGAGNLMFDSMDPSFSSAVYPSDHLPIIGDILLQ
jgi:endonuclease/exonuclease/phosphatase family metal-dependent hydrolase